MRKENNDLLFHSYPEGLHLSRVIISEPFSTQNYGFCQRNHRDCFQNIRKILEFLTNKMLLQRAEKRDITGCKVEPLRTMFEGLQSKFLQKGCRLSGYVLLRHRVISHFSAL